MNHDSMPLPSSAGGFWLQFVQWLAGNGYAPHSGCFLGDHIWVGAYVGANWVIALAYALVSLLIWQRMKRASHIPRTLMGNALLGIFVTCAGGHFLAGITTVLWPGYRFETMWHWLTTIPAWIFLAHHNKFSLIVEGPHMIAESREELSHKNGELNTLYEQVKEVDRLKSEFFANVSHELRTPLALILGPISNVLAGDNLTDAQRRDLEVVSRNARTVLKHVNDLLDIARMEAGKMKLRYAEVDLAQTARVLASHFESVIAERGLTFTLDAPPTLVAQLDGDKMQRVLLNLFSNAVKFVPAGGQIICRLAYEDTDVAIEVQDNGPGVPEDLRDAIFDRFRQADASATRQHEGTGLGLAIVKDFVELHGGAVTLREAPGGGALFRMRIPIFAPEGVTVMPPADEAGDSKDTARTENPGVDAGTSEGHSMATDNAAGEVAEGVPSAPPGHGSAWNVVASVPTSALPGSLDNVMIQTLDELRAREEAEALTQDTGQPLVLVVEDNREMSRFISQTLSPMYRTEAAYNGDEGLERALELRPDLILSDIMMPGKSGDQMVAELRTHPQLDDLPILLLTAKADDDLRVRLLRTGAQDYLMKPFAPEELRARVTNLVAMKRARQTLQSEVATQQQSLEMLAIEVIDRKRALQTALQEAQTARLSAEHAREEAQRHEIMVERRNKQLLVAIQEAHHRIKNNLQKVSALIEMELDACGDAVPSEAVRARLYQIKAIAIVHDLLTQDTDFNEVDAGDALRRLVDLLQATYRSVPGALPLELDADTLVVPAKVAISLALIVTELVSNAQQHGQPILNALPGNPAPSRLSSQSDRMERSQEPKPQNAILIQLRHREGQAVLVVTDPGRGFAPDFNIFHDANLGLELVRTLTESDLQGHLEFGAGTGDTGTEIAPAGEPKQIISAASNGSGQPVRPIAAGGGRVAITFPEYPDAA